jgi:hypothetical protein
MKRLENASNIAVIIAVVVLLVMVGRNEYRSYILSHPARALIGRTITLPGVRFPSQRKTLILAISTNCHFCQESQPFYKTLIDRANGRVDIIAVLPQSLAEAQLYVQKSLAPSVQVVSARLDSVGVGGTPTLLLVDQAGKVEQAWIGKLDDQRQQQVESLVTQ